MRSVTGLRERCLWLTLILLLLLGGLCMAEPAEGQEIGTQIDIVVVLDDSDSMHERWTLGGNQTYPPTDPDNLRYSAARLLVHLLEDGDRVFFVSFGSQVHSLTAWNACQGKTRAEVESLSATACPMIEVAGHDSVQAILDKIQMPDLTGQGTRIDLGYLMASRVLRSHRQDGRPQYILFLTDGTPAGQKEGTPAKQRSFVLEQAETDRQQGISTVAIGLCNAEAGCKSVDRDLLLGMVGSADRSREAKTPNELVRAFGEIVSQLKPNLFVTDVPANADKNLEIWTSQEQAVVAMNVVMAGKDLTELRCGQEVAWVPGQTPSNSDWALYDYYDRPDGNFALLSLRSGKPLVGSPWQIATGGRAAEAFAVVQTTAYPRLVFPPAADVDDPASSRYYRPGTSLLVVAQAIRNNVAQAGQEMRLTSPAGAQPLQGNLLGQGQLYAGELMPPGSAFHPLLQIGSNDRVLRVERAFHLKPWTGLPELQVVSPAPGNLGLLSGGTRVQLEAEFLASSGITDLTIHAYVMDITDPENPSFRSETDLRCSGLSCSADSGDLDAGRSYAFYFLATGQSEGRRFGDWAKSTLSMDPRIVIDGLPDVLDPLTMPRGGWPVSVTTASTGGLGQLGVRLDLVRQRDSSKVEQVEALFSANLESQGQQNALLTFTGLEELDADVYHGTLSFVLEGGARAEIVPSTLEVRLDLTSLHAEFLQESIDFGQVDYWPPGEAPSMVEPSYLRVAFRRDPFTLISQSEEGSCPGLRAEALPVEPSADGTYLLPIQLVLGDRVAPGRCEGNLVLHGPSRWATVAPVDTIHWQAEILAPNLRVEVPEVLDFGDLWQEGQEAHRQLTIHFPRRVYPLQGQLEIVKASRINRLPEDGDVVVTVGEPECVQAEGVVTDCSVPLTVRLTRDLPRSTYLANLRVSVTGLDETIVTIPVTFRSSSWWDRFATRMGRWFHAAGMWIQKWFLVRWTCCFGWAGVFILAVLARVFAGLTHESPEPQSSDSPTDLPTPGELELGARESWRPSRVSPGPGRHTRGAHRSTRRPRTAPTGRASPVRGGARRLRGGLAVRGRTRGQVTNSGSRSTTRVPSRRSRRPSTASRSTSRVSAQPTQGAPKVVRRRRR